MCSSEIREKKSLKIVYLNIRSLTKIDRLIMELRELNETPDVIAIVETHLKPTTESKFKYKWPGYKAEFMSREMVKQGGIAVFYREELKIEKLRFQHVGINHLMLIKLLSFNVDLLVIYRTYDKKCGKRAFWEKLNDMLPEKNSLRKMIVLGDSNMDVLHEKNPRYMKMFASKGFRICNRTDPECYTRKEKRSGEYTYTIIDHVFANMHMTPVNVQYFDVDFSDHRMLIANVEL